MFSSHFCFFFFFLNNESIDYIPSPGDVFRGKRRKERRNESVFVLFFYFVGRTDVRWASCSGLYSLVHSPRLNRSCETSRRAGNCAGGQRRGLVSKQPGGKPLCHPRATSETILLQPSAFFFFCGGPWSGLKPLPPKKRDRRGSCITPALRPPRGLQRGRPAAGSREETATLTARLPFEWGRGLIHGGERPGVPMTTGHPLRSVSLTQMTNFPAFRL